MTDAIRKLIRSGGKVLGVRLPRGEERFDIGNFESYFLAFVEFALADPQYGAGPGGAAGSPVGPVGRKDSGALTACA